MRGVYIRMVTISCSRPTIILCGTITDINSVMHTQKKYLLVLNYYWTSAPNKRHCNLRSRLSDLSVAKTRRFDI